MQPLRMIAVQDQSHSRGLSNKLQIHAFKANVTIYSGGWSWSVDGPVTLWILVSLPPTYPSSAPPQLQLISKYIGNLGADLALLGAILRTYISVNGVEWSRDTVCVFDGLQSVVEWCTVWYENWPSAANF